MILKTKNSYSCSDIKNLALTVRKELKTPLTKPLNCEKLLNYFMLKYDFNIKVEEDDSTLYLEENEVARYIPDQKVLILRSEVYNNLDLFEKNDSNEIRYIKGRSRFTICHEMFHIYQVNELKEEYAISNEITPSYINPEWQANEFAAKLLVPITVDTLSDDIIHYKYCVTYECIEVLKDKSKKRQERKNKPIIN